MMKHNKDEAFDVLNALCGRISYHGNDDGFKLWTHILTELRKYRDLPQDLESIKKNKENCPLINSERPDVIYKGDGFVLGIECFQYDSSKMTNKGSTMLRSQAKLEKDLMDTYLATGNRYISGNNQADLNYQEYINSAIETMKKHVKNIDTYRKHIMELNEDNKCILAFFMNDSTILGNYAITEKGIKEPLRIVCAKEFLELIKRIEGLDYIICRNQYDYLRYESLIIQCSPEVYDEINSETYDESKLIFSSEKSGLVQSVGRTSV